MISTRFTQEFDIEHPIVCGGMTGAGRAVLIAAVANAGALGFLSALTQPTPAALDEEIRKTKALTDRPFGVNLTILPTIAPVPYDEYRQVIIDNGISIVETAGSSPKDHLPSLKSAGIKVIHKTVAVRHSISAQKLGVDALSVDGFECAGHPGEDDVSSLVLIPAVAARTDLPIIASGGFATGAGLVAALALGADAINMGTRFVATAEAPVHRNVKDRIVANTERDTNLIFRKFRNTARVAKNAVSDEILDVEKREGTTFEDIASLASGARGRQNVLAEGRMDDGLWWVGQSQALVTDILTCADVVKQIINDAEELIDRRLTGLVAY
ncbi:MULTISPECIES: nitronate monooxygenase family protein [unclassified Rhodococcus (in: high G+C Gram-positive bacteria)]|uniref:NAD(P)H-dependent flavin oxidoreductase n=1 Tax=unclassified Rhodococcus (in: high G+C Gram-positive bacteria) TaxID=192944 RepID=UPI000B9B2CA3|nr:MULTISPECIES: nitronate monooxygenase [unclassified Rhodococcus (in: high G+C Gram-positive bacteria)]OZE37593.1 nitronate monooxygenase [Rhodococcus sp. 05-2254-4]OZE40725.1 nitronate monooxygenase [Rhodococcus sp. 05-2254-3]OZE45716.1 nitronate monooxygenase [Rhodococcus sp. 05-2254-2]